MSARIRATILPVAIVAAWLAAIVVMATLQPPRPPIVQLRVAP